MSILITADRQNASSPASFDREDDLVVLFCDDGFFGIDLENCQMIRSFSRIVACQARTLTTVLVDIPKDGARTSAAYDLHLSR
jgi:hypothetical protein